jgi:DNA-binding SARP family transcriptional activator
MNGGDTSVAHASVQRWLTMSPLNDEAHRRLMRVHFAAGDRSAALRAYEGCRSLLALYFRRLLGHA